jgi:bile acid:Na+ symporter, BASS family
VEEWMSYFLPIAIATIMFGIGMNLLPKHFKHVFIRPKGILTGLVAQLVLLPLLGFALAYFSPIDPIFKLGIVLIAACPGGTSSNLITYLLGGRVALSVSITAFNSLFIIFTIPLILSIGTLVFLDDSAAVALSFWQTFREILWTVVLPVFLGMQFRLRMTRLAFHIRPLLKYLLPLILFLTFGLVIFSEENTTTSINLSDNLWLFVPAIVLNIGAMFTGYYLAKLVGITHSGRYTIAIEMGLQNTVLAIFIANSLLQISGLAIVAVVYGSFSFFSTFIVGWIMKKSGSDPLDFEG